MLGDALTRDKAEAADQSRVCVRASVSTCTHESSTMQRAHKEREASSVAKADCKIRGHGQRMVDGNVPGLSHRRGSDRDPRQQERVACE